jgi:hypothetical protein
MKTDRNVQKKLSTMESHNEDEKRLRKRVILKQLSESNGPGFAYRSYARKTNDRKSTRNSQEIHQILSPKLSINHPKIYFFRVT